MIKALVKDYGLNDGKHRSVPMDPGAKLSQSSGEPLNTDVSTYSHLVGCLLYLSITTRPDIAFAVGALSRYLHAPTTQHWILAKGVLRYLAGIATVGLNFRGSAEPVHAYCDSDYPSDVDTRRSTTGYVFLMSGAAISWQSRLQQTVALSSAEAEYMSAIEVIKEALWLKVLLVDLGMPASALKIFCDNQSALALLKSPVLSPKTKHIDIKYHFARHHVMRKAVVFEYIPTDQMVADVLTKALSAAKFKKFCAAMGLA